MGTEINSPWLLCEKASIECGLAEMMKKKGAPHPAEAPDKDSLQPWILDLAELYSMLPTESQDPSFQPIKQKVIQI